MGLGISSTGGCSNGRCGVGAGSADQTRTAMQAPAAATRTLRKTVCMRLMIRHRSDPLQRSERTTVTEIPTPLAPIGDSGEGINALPGSVGEQLHPAAVESA